MSEFVWDFGKIMCVHGYRRDYCFGIVLYYSRSVLVSGALFECLVSSWNKLHVWWRGMKRNFHLFICGVFDECGSLRSILGVPMVPYFTQVPHALSDSLSWLGLSIDFISSLKVSDLTRSRYTLVLIMTQSQLSWSWLHTALKCNLGCSICIRFFWVDKNHPPSGRLPPEEF